MQLMPNHLHGILFIADRTGGSRAARTPAARTPAARTRAVSTSSRGINPKPLGQLIGAFKTVSTKRINLLRGTPGGRVWQRGYYEHVIRIEAELDRVREYIVNNPLQWDLDRENPAVHATGPEEPWKGP